MPSSMQRIIDRKNNDIMFSFGNWDDHYVRQFGKCHPNFDTVLLDKDPRSVKVCKRRVQDTFNRDNPYEKYKFINKDEKIVNRDLENANNYNRQLSRFSRQIYTPSNKPIQPYNPYPRVPPHEDYNIVNEYYKLPIEFNGTGLLNYKVCPDYRKVAYQTVV